MVKKRVSQSEKVLKKVEKEVEKDVENSELVKEWDFKALVIISLVFIFWIFFYYRFHRTIYVPISLILGSGVLMFIGIYAFFIEKNVKFRNVKTTYIIMVILLLTAQILIFWGVFTQGLNQNVDITLTLMNKLLGMPVVYGFLAFCYIGIFFIIVGTRKIMGREYIYFWTLIILAYTISNIRLLIYLLK